MTYWDTKRSAQQRGRPNNEDGPTTGTAQQRGRPDLKCAECHEWLQSIQPLIKATLQSAVAAGQSEARPVSQHTSDPLEGTEVRVGTRVMCAGR